MKQQLRQVLFNPAQAQAANWYPTELAAQCGVSLRTLERFFLMEMQQSPSVWLAHERQKKRSNY